jgi:sporulation protein YlmC with PRC-barrel domain
MAINSKQLMNLPVLTKSGIKVGRLASLDIDADSGKLTAIRVRIPGAVPHLMDREIIVNWPQIVSLSEKEAVIADAVVPVGSKLLAKGAAPHVTS